MIKKTILLLILLLSVSCTYDVIEDTHYFDGDVTVVNNLTVQGTIIYNSHYAEAFYNNITNPVVINLVNEDEWYNVSGFEIRDNNGIILNPDNISVTVNRSGTYKVASHIAFSGGNSGEYELSLFVNNVSNRHCALYRSTGSAAKGTASFSCIGFYNSGDVLKMMMRDTTSPVQDPQFFYMNFNMFELI